MRSILEHPLSADELEAWATTLGLCLEIGMVLGDSKSPLGHHPWDDEVSYLVHGLKETYFRNVPHFALTVYI